jgi:hypothetical protein
VLQSPELREIIDFAVMADPEIAIALVGRNLLLAPSLVVIWAEESTELDDVEDHGCVEKEDETDKYEFFPPSHSDVWPFHPADVAEHERRYPEGEGPNESDP